MIIYQDNCMSDKRKLQPYLTPAGAWALSLGTSIGWGSLVITSSAYLSQAGPGGSLLGLAAGTVIMLIISRSYAYMINCCPDAGGVYAYSKETFGHDHGFLTAWFLTLTYLAMLWANATSLPLFARYFIGDFFETGYLFTIFGYPVYLAEVLLTAGAILLSTLLCARHRHLPARMMTAMCAFFTAAILFCTAAALFRTDRAFDPAFIPDTPVISQVVRIAMMSPWAFIGFENISHAVEEFDFPRKKTGRILAAGVVTSAVLYAAIILLSISAYPGQFDSWLSYIRNLSQLSGIEALPPFYAAYTWLGNFGVNILMAALLALVITSLIGNITALSRLFYALAEDGIIPDRYAELNDRRIPHNAVMLIFLLSCAVPLLGRTAVGWIVDVTTLGAVLIYGYVSACALKKAGTYGDRNQVFPAAAGIVIMLVFGIWLLVPNLFTSGSLESESYFLFVIWSILGFLFFHSILRKDKDRRFGRSIVVWIVLLSLVLFVSLVWMSQSTMRVTADAMNHIQDYYAEAGFTAEGEKLILQELDTLRMTNARSIAVVVAMFGISLGVLLNNYSIMNRRAAESETELGIVRNKANTDPLTGVKSKHAYTEKESEINAMILAGSAPAMAAAVCDLNGLKHINDTYGHKAGDEYIRAAARMICELFQHSPVYRIGGDEFAVVLSGRDYENREQIKEQLMEISLQNIASGQVVVACGIAEYIPGKDTQWHSVFERADSGMYAAKKQLKDAGAITR